jgi:transposase-like protein
MSRLDAIRQIGVVEQTYYRWRKQVITQLEQSLFGQMPQQHRRPLII